MASRKTKGQSSRRKPRTSVPSPAGSRSGDPVSEAKEGASAVEAAAASTSAEAPRLRMALLGLPALAAVCMGLAIFQWMELLLLDAGQGAACSINETFNCAAVWEAPLAKQWQAATGVPVAGWGLIWAALAFGASLWAVGARLYDRPPAAAHGAVWVLAGAGVATSLLLGAYALYLGQVCLTCLATYVLVGGFALLALGLPRPGWAGLRAAVGPLAVGTVVAYGLAVVPGWATPLPGELATASGSSNGKPKAAGEPEAAKPQARAKPEPAVRSTSDVAAYLSTLAPAVRRNIARGLEEFRRAPAPALPSLSPRPFEGTDGAPVQIVDFSDMRCPHCARLAIEMERFAEEAPADGFRLESRFFPLDSECNPKVPFSDGTHVRCTAAKALLCTQDSPQYNALRLRLFREQANLSSVDRVFTLAEEIAGRDARALRQCIESAATATKLAEDIAFAERFNIEGTPMVVLNGRQVGGFPPLLMALVLAEGDVNHPDFASLQP